MELREPVSQATSFLADVSRRAERLGNAIDDVIRNTNEGVVDMIGMLVVGKIVVLEK